MTEVPTRKIDKDFESRRYIKPLLVQCATAVVKSEKHPEIRNRYLQFKKHRGHKLAIIAIARMLLTVIYHVLKKKEAYNPDLYKKSDVRPVTREITVEQANLLVQAQDYLIKAAANRCPYNKKPKITKFSSCARLLWHGAFLLLRTFT